AFLVNYVKRKRRIHLTMWLIFSYPDAVCITVRENRDPTFTTTTGFNATFYEVCPCCNMRYSVTNVFHAVNHAKSTLKDHYSMTMIEMFCFIHQKRDMLLP